MAADLVFYTNPISRGRIVRWMLEEVAAPYRTEIIQYGANKAPGYLAINPMGKLPAITHGGVVVTECAAICAYLADAFPEAGLAPPLDDRGAYYRWLFFAAGPIEASTTNKALGFVVPEGREMMAGYGTHEAVLNAMEGVLSRSAYVAGDRFTAADVYFGSQIGFGIRFASLEQRPAFVDYWNRISSRPASVRAAAMDDALMPAPAAAPG